MANAVLVDSSLSCRYNQHWNAMITVNEILSRRQEIIAIASRYGASNIRVFGSVVRGDNRSDSDLDILVHLDSDRSLLDHIALKQDIEDVLGCKVDIVEDDNINGAIRDRVLSEAMAI